MVGLDKTSCLGVGWDSRWQGSKGRHKRGPRFWTWGGGWYCTIHFWPRIQAQAQSVAFWGIHSNFAQPNPIMTSENAGALQRVTESRWSLFERLQTCQGLEVWPSRICCGRNLSLDTERRLKRMSRKSVSWPLGLSSFLHWRSTFQKTISTLFSTTLWHIFGLFTTVQKNLVKKLASMVQVRATSVPRLTPFCVACESSCPLEIRSLSSVFQYQQVMI